MPKFAYAAIDPQGGSVEGFTKADTIGEARKYLLGENLYPTKLEEHRGAMSFELTKEKVKKKELMHFTRQLAVFVKAGIPITDALETIGDETGVRPAHIKDRIRALGPTVRMDLTLKPADPDAGNWVI